MGDSNAYILGTDQEELKKDSSFNTLSGPLNPMWVGEQLVLKEVTPFSI